MPRTPAAALFLVLSAGSLGAGEGKLEPPDLDRYLRWGPLRVRPGVALTNLGYDDNILANESDKISDYTATISPRVNGLVLFGDSFLTFRGSLGYTVYFQTSDQNFFDYTTSARYTLPVRGYGVFAEVGLSEFTARPIDREDIRQERRERKVGAGVILQPGWRTEIEIAARRSDWRFRDEDALVDPSTDLDRDEEGLSLEASYRVLGRTRITFDLSTEELRFDNSTERDADELTLLPGIKLAGGGPLTGHLRVGWSEVDARDPAVRPFSGLVGDAELAYRLRGGTTAFLEFEREQHFTVNAEQRYFRSTRYGARVVHYLNRLLGVELGAETGSLTFEEGPPREDDLFRYSAGVRVRLSENQIGRKVEYALKITRYERDSTEPTANIDRTRVAIDAVVGF